MRALLCALSLLLCSSIAYAENYMLLTQTHGGDLKFNKHLTKYECEVARDRLLGRPATQEEKRVAKEKAEKEKSEIKTKRATDIEKIISTCHLDNKRICNADGGMCEREEWKSILCNVQGTSLANVNMFHDLKTVDCKAEHSSLITCKAGTPPAKIREYLLLLAEDGWLRTSNNVWTHYPPPLSGEIKTAECFDLKEEKEKP